MRCARDYDLLDRQGEAELKRGSKGPPRTEDRRLSRARVVLKAACFIGEHPREIRAACTFHIAPAAESPEAFLLD